MPLIAAHGSGKLTPSPPEKPLDSAQREADAPVAITAGHDGNLLMWDLATGRPQTLTTGDTEILTAATTTLHGQPIVVAGDRRGALRVWDLSTSRLITTFFFPAEITAVTPFTDRLIVGFGPDVAMLTLPPDKPRPLSRT